MAESEQSEPDWELLGEFARRRDELDPVMLRAMLATSLRKRGFGNIVWPDDGNADEKPADRAGALVMVGLVWSLAVSATTSLGLAWFLIPVAAIAVVLVLAVLANALNRAGAAAGVLLLAWIGIGVAEALDGNLVVFVIAYGVPVGVGLLYGTANRLLRLRDAQDIALALAGAVKSAPLVAPVVLTVLFVPALSSDVWRIAGAIDAKALSLVGVLTVGVLFVLVRAQLGSQIRPMIVQRASHLCDLGTRAELTRQQISATTDKDATALVDEMPDSRIDSAWPPAGEEYAPYLHTAVGGELGAPLTSRLAITVGVTGALFSGYIYLLCSAVVPLRIAATWSQSATPSTRISLLGITWSLGAGPYLHLAVLLGLAATATFLSFALVEDRFAQALTDALLRDPADRFLALGLPYVSLTEQAIQVGRRHQLGMDLTPSPPAEES